MKLITPERQPDPPITIQFTRQEVHALLLQLGDMPGACSGKSGVDDMFAFHLWKALKAAYVGTYSPRLNPDLAQIIPPAGALLDADTDLSS